MIVASIAFIPVRARAGSLPPLVVSERLYAWSGSWRPVDWRGMVNSQPLRIAVQIETPYSPAAGISVRFTLRHVSWQGSRRVVQAPDVEGNLRQTLQRGHMAHFEAIVRVPVTHPLQFTRVLVTITQGSLRRVVMSGVEIEPPIAAAQAMVRLTVPQVFSFCSSRPGLDFLSYGVAVRGYVRGDDFKGGDGPPQWLILAHPHTRKTNTASLLRRHEGFLAGGFGNPPRGKLTTIPGSLVCRPQIFFGMSP
jgi:hypothetical protein